MDLTTVPASGSLCNQFLKTNSEIKDPPDNHRISSGSRARSRAGRVPARHLRRSWGDSFIAGRASQRSARDHADSWTDANLGVESAPAGAIVRSFGGGGTRSGTGWHGHRDSCRVRGGSGCGVGRAFPNSDIRVLRDGGTARGEPSGVAKTGAWIGGLSARWGG